MQAVEPQIAELLRTTIHPPSLILRVAHVEFVEADQHIAESFTSNSGNEKSDSRRKNGYLGKFLLSDGKLMIQALLHRRLCGLEDVGSVEKGDIIHIRRFTVNKAPRLDGAGKIVYLGIEDCTFLLRPATDNAFEAGSVQQITTLNATSKKRARIGDDEEPLGIENRTFGFGDAKSLVQQTPKRVRMSIPEEDDLILPSSIPSTPPLSLRDLDEFIAVPSTTNGQERRMLSPRMKSTASSGQKRSGIKRNNDHLSRTFGARIILSDDDEDDDFFEPIQAIRTPAKVARSEFRNPYDSPRAGRSAAKQGNDNRSAIDSFSFSKLTDARPYKKEVTEPQLPPQPVSKRDGTFALSQTASFYQAQIPAQHSTTTAHPQRPITAPSRSTAPHPNPIPQSPLLPAPPFYTLNTLRHPPTTQTLPKNNVTVTVLGVISWLGTSLLHRAGSPFPPKRHLKIVDPSLAASRPESRDTQLQVPTNTSMPRSSNNVTMFKPQTTFQDSVTVAVYIDAADFKPAAGTIALFRGLVMQRLANGDIILNAYARLKEQRFADGVVATSEQAPTTAGVQHDNFSHWYVTDPDRIRALGYGGKMDYYREWWTRRQSAT